MSTQTRRRPALVGVEPNAPPQNLDAEESVLGAMLISKGAITAVSDILLAGHFYFASHGLIYDTILALDSRSIPADWITVVDELEQTGKLEEAGGKARIAELAVSVPATANAAHYARIVREMSILRGLIRAGGEIARLGWERPGDVPELLVHAEAELSSVTQGADSTEFRSIGETTDSFYAEIAEAVATKTPIFGTRTRFYDLDKITTGFHPGQLIVVAARPSVGKSLLGQNIAENVADDGQPAAIFSLEMSERELQIRSIVRETRLSAAALRTGQLVQEELELVAETLPKLRQRPLYVDDTAGVSVTELRARARRLARRHGLKLLVVDYLQLMTDASKSQDGRTQEVSAISRALKLLAKELAIPVIAISQLNRQLEYRADKRPTLADLRESGSIEQDADLVLFLFREELYSDDPSLVGKTELIVAKNRMGELGTVHLLFLGARQTFATPAAI